MYKDDSVVDKSSICTESEHVVTCTEGLLCCPADSQDLWNGHPRVYLSFDSSGFTQCPYCGDKYVLRR